MKAKFAFKKSIVRFRAVFVEKEKGDSFARSTKRANYQPGGMSTLDDPEKTPQMPSSKPCWFPNFLYVLLTLALLILIYPAGLVLLWIRKFKARASLKMAISIAGCIAFLCLFSYFFNAPKLNPALEPLQAKVRSAFSFYGDDSKVVVEQYEDRVSSFPENISNVTFHAIRYVQRTLAENIRLLSGRHARIAQKSKDLFYVALIRTNAALDRPIENPAEAPTVSPSEPS